MNENLRGVTQHMCFLALADGALKFGRVYTVTVGFHITGGSPKEGVLLGEPVLLHTEHMELRGKV